MLTMKEKLLTGVVECLKLSIHEVLVQSPAWHKWDVGVHTCDPSLQEVEDQKLKVILDSIGGSMTAWET